MQAHSLANCFATAFSRKFTSATDQERRLWAKQGPFDADLVNGFHLGLEQLQSMRPLELLVYASYWSLFAVRKADEYARKLGELGAAHPEKSPGWPSSTEHQQPGAVYLFKSRGGPTHSADSLLAMCLWTRGWVLGLCGRHLDALEAGRLALGCALRSKDHELVACVTGFISDAEEAVAAVEEMGKGKDHEDDEEVEGSE